MDGRTGLVRNNRKFIKSHKGEEVVENHNRIRPERTRHKRSLELA